MSVIEHIEIRCIEQEDYTGTDDLKFYLNGIHVGNLDNVSPGNHDVGKTDLWGELWVDEGTVLKIEEYDTLGSNDVLLEYTITGSDISNGSVFLRDQISSAKYEFTVHFVEF
jgi:hypothetical protein